MIVLGWRPSATLVAIETGRGPNRVLQLLPHHNAHFYSSADTHEPLLAGGLRNHHPRI
jgi:hypothetical protein